MFLRPVSVHVSQFSECNIQKLFRPIYSKHYLINNNNKLFTMKIENRMLSSQTQVSHSKFTESQSLYSPQLDYHWGSSMLKRLEEVQSSFVSHQRALLQGFVVLTAIGSWIVLIFGDEIKEFWGKQGADIGKMVLSDESVQKQAEILSKALAEKFLTDPQMEEVAVRFVTRVAKSMLEDPQIVEKGVDFVSQLMQKEEIQQQTSKLLLYALSHPNTQTFVQSYFSNLLLKQDIQTNSTLLGLGVCHELMNDDKVKEHLTAMITEIINDQTLQQQTGNMLWSAAKYALFPFYTTTNPKPKYVVSPTK